MPVGRLQATLAVAFERPGRSLHSGRHATIRVCPAPAGHGIVFRRSPKTGRSIDGPAPCRYRGPQPLSAAVRHRIPDLIGDLTLASHPVDGRIAAFHTGHELNHAPMRETSDWAPA